MSASARTGAPASSASRTSSSVVLPAGRPQAHAVAAHLDRAEHGDSQHAPSVGRVPRTLTGPVTAPSAAVSASSAPRVIVLSCLRDTRPATASSTASIGGEPDAARRGARPGRVVRPHRRCSSPRRCSPSDPDVLARAAPARRVTARDRQLVALADAHLARRHRAARRARPRPPRRPPRPPARGLDRRPATVRHPPATPADKEHVMSDLSTSTDPAPVATRPPGPHRRCAGWSPSLGFPLGGLAAFLLVGPVDGLAAALAGGLVTGAVLGAVQAWALRAARPAPTPGSLATAIGLMIGLAVGAAVVDYRTGLGDLALQGAICGVASAPPRPSCCSPRARPARLGAGRAALGGIWALGWVVTTVGRRPGRRAVHRLRRRPAPSSSPPSPRSFPVLAPPPRSRTSTLMTRHVVFGTGQVGHPLVAAARRPGPRRRRRQPQRPGRPPRRPRSSRGDATDPAFTTGVCRGADVVYFCLNAVNYEPLGRGVPAPAAGVLAGAASAGARLVVLENLYAYGPPRGRRLVETMAANPTSREVGHPGRHDRRAARRPRRRAGRGGHRPGVRLLRSRRDRTPRSGETVFGAAARRQGRPGDGRPGPAAQLLLHARRGRRPDHPGHRRRAPPARSGTCRSPRRGPPGRSSSRSTRWPATRPRILAAGRTTLRAIGLVKPEMREYLHTLYQFTDPLGRRRRQVPRRRSAT